MPRAKDQNYIRNRSVAVRMSDATYESLQIAAAIELRTVSSLMEWLAVKYIDENIEKIDALRKIRTD